jgi:hypothetical protein
MTPRFSTTKTTREMKIPIELLETSENIDQLIVYLKITKKLLQGKAVTSEQGLGNKIKHYLLGYLLVEKTAICEKCSSIMILEDTTNGFKLDGKKFSMKFVTHGNEKSRYRYFRCPKCGWSLCTDE